MAANNLTTSADGIDKLEVREALIDGLYDDVSGYATYGVGHLVHPTDKWKSFLLESSRSQKLCDSRVKKKWPGTSYEVAYLEREVVACAEYDQLKTKAEEGAREVIAQRKFSKKFADLKDAEKAAVTTAASDAVGREAQLLNQTTASVFAQDLKPYEMAVNTSVTAIELTQEEFDALVSFSFNVGTSAFAGSSLLKKINENTYRNGAVADREKAIKEVETSFLAWNKSGGSVVDGLTKRRQDEADQFLSRAREDLKKLQATPAKGASLPPPTKAPLSGVAMAAVRGVRPTRPA
jgi:GH24 family phage-related lysozyme (muramidase)